MAPAFSDLISGQVQVIFPSLISAIEYIRAGRLRALAVTTAKRSEALPDVSTVDEFVPGYEASTWYGVGAPKNTPIESVDKLNKEINAGLADPKMKARFAGLDRIATRSRCANKRHHAIHSMTSSARATRFGGTVRPSVLTVLRLITSSNFVGCITGRSAGFTP